MTATRDFVMDTLDGVKARMATHMDRFRDIVGRVSYKPGWRFRIGGDPGRYWLQVEFDAADTDASYAHTQVQRGRKWLLSEHMTESEIVQTAFRAVLGAEEHECRETFKLEGVAVLGPHVDLFALTNLQRAGMLALDVRATPSTTNLGGPIEVL